jgi:hypothetical protein
MENKNTSHPLRHNKNTKYFELTLEHKTVFGFAVFLLRGICFAVREMMSLQDYYYYYYVLQYFSKHVININF